MSEQREFIRAQLSSGVDYYKGEKGDKPIKGVDYFTPADIESIVELIEAGEIDFSSYASKDYVDDAIEAIEIPPAYTLPTASTSTLGGVKVDGTTITISDGVISSAGGGGSDIVFNTTYDADTNKAATMADVDDAVMNAELPASAIAAGMNEQHEPVYLNEVLHNIETTLSGKQDALVFNTAYDASMNKVATMADVDDAITYIELPASVIAAGETEQHEPKYLNTVLNEMNTAISGKQDALVFNTAYDAVNNKVATMSDVDDAITYIELPASVIATGITEQQTPVYLNQTLHDIDTTLAGKQDSLVFNTAYNASSNKVATMADIPSAYTLPTASTSTLGGVKVDGSTITIDNNGVISSTASGGSSYTAGSGISIDSNNVISNTKQSTFPFSFLSNMLPAYNAYTISAQGMTWNQFLENLRAGKVVSTLNVSADWINVGSKQLDAASVAGDANAKYYVVNLSSEPANNFSSNSSRALAGYAYYFDGIVLYMWNNGKQWSDWINVSWGGQSAKLKTVLSTLYDNQLPTAPSADGTYFLTTTISSGVATNSWQSVVIGGSY